MAGNRAGARGRCVKMAHCVVVFAMLDRGLGLKQSTGLFFDGHASAATLPLCASRLLALHPF